MPKTNIPQGKCNISHGIFKGYTAPDEDVERPVPAELEGELYSRRKAAWQPVQVEIPERVHRIGYRSFEDCRGLTAVSMEEIVCAAGILCVGVARIANPALTISLMKREKDQSGA